MNRRASALALPFVVALIGCGHSDSVYVAKPSRPHYVCRLGLAKRRGCVNRFDANRLVGLTVAAATRLAREHGYELHVINEYNDLMLLFDRLDVDATSPTGSGIVTKFAEQG